MAFARRGTVAAAAAAAARRQEAGGKVGRATSGLFRRRRVCKFCADKIDNISYKDVKLLAPFMPSAARFSRAGGKSARPAPTLEAISARVSLRSCRIRPTRTWRLPTKNCSLVIRSASSDLTNDLRDRHGDT